LIQAVCNLSFPRLPCLLLLAAEEWFLAAMLERCFSGLYSCFRATFLASEFASVTPELRQRIRSRKGRSPLSRSHLDIHTLLVCPDPSRKIDRSYKTLELLGHGAYGKVFRIQRICSGDIRAIKVMPKLKLAEDVQRMVTEIQALIELDHPNIMKMYEYFEDPQAIYLVTELCDGGHLGELDTATTDPDEIRWLFRDIVCAVAYCHSEGLAHRDLKFENVMLTECGGRHCGLGRMAKVIDFGLSSFRQDGTAKQWMKENVGTLYFVAPEVLKNEGTGKENTYGAECDMWSIGVMMYILLTGQHPFMVQHVSKSPRAIVQQISHGVLRQAPLSDAEVQPKACELLEKLLEKDPTCRVSAMSALEHPWLRVPLVRRTLSRTTSKDSTCSEGAPVPRMLSMVGRILSFSKFTRFEKAILTLVVHAARSRELEDLTRAFHALDSSGAGWLSAAGFCSGLQKQGIQLSEDDLQLMLGCLDPDSDDKIQYTDWLAATFEPCGITSDRAIEELFDFFDLHGKGTVSMSDLSDIVEEDMTAVIFEQAQPDSPGFISKSEFRTLVISVAGKLARDLEWQKAQRGLNHH